MVVVEGELIFRGAAAGVVARVSTKEAAVVKASGEMIAGAAADESNAEVVADVTVLSAGVCGELAVFEEFEVEEVGAGIGVEGGIED